ncbi:uncharacterized protein LOC135119114 [Helicoverpa armigera]|uniref:uncharacterized protein LOC135119114 n=1 Tax=Helicoverpa armigera TaxID=29058 RepID=UPI0030836EBA
MTSLFICQQAVTALCALRGELYIGTAWGCVIVADATSLRPLTVFRPYEEDVRVIIPLHPHKAEEAPMIATFGHGYRPLLQRYAPHSSSSTNTHNGYYCLLWQTQHWLPD